MIMRPASSDLREYLSLTVNALLAERRRRKPGGPRTDLGALRQLDPGAFAAKVTSTMASKGGDVDGRRTRPRGVSPHSVSLLGHGVVVGWGGDGV